MSSEANAESRVIKHQRTSNSHDIYDICCAKHKSVTHRSIVLSSIGRRGEKSAMRTSTIRLIQHLWNRVELQETVDTLLCTTIRPPHTYSHHVQFQLAETLWDIHLAKLLVLHLSTWSANRNVLDLKACVDNKDTVSGWNNRSADCFLSD